MAEKSFWGNKKDKEWFANFFHYYGIYVVILIFFAFVTPEIVKSESINVYFCAFSPFSVNIVCDNSTGPEIVV